MSSSSVPNASDASKSRNPDISARLARFFEHYRSLRRLSVRKLCAHSGCRRSASTIRRLLSEPGRPWSVDTAKPLVAHAAQDWGSTWPELWVYLAEDNPRPDSPFADAELPAYWHAAPEAVPALWHQILRNAGDIHRSTSYGEWPYALIPTGLLAKYVEAWAERRRLTRRAYLAEKRLAEKERECFINCFAEGTARCFMLSRRLAPASQHPMRIFAEPELAEIWESLQHDAIRERHAQVCVVEDEEFPQRLREHFQGYDHVWVENNRLIIKRLRGSTTRVIYERCGSAPINQRLEHELRMLKEIEKHVPAGFSTPAALAEVKAFLWQARSGPLERNHPKDDWVTPC